MIFKTWRANRRRQKLLCLHALVNIWSLQAAAACRRYDSDRTSLRLTLMLNDRRGESGVVASADQAEVDDRYVGDSRAKLEHAQQKLERLVAQLLEQLVWFKRIDAKALAKNVSALDRYAERNGHEKMWHDANKLAQSLRAILNEPLRETAAA